MKQFVTMVIFVLTAALSACTSAHITATHDLTRSSTFTGEGAAPGSPATPQQGARARIAISDFEDKTVSSGTYRLEYGRGLRDMLATALVQSGRFDVLEREKLQAVLAEQDLGASGRFRKKTAAPIGGIEGADLLVVAAVTAFDPEAAGASGNAGSFLGALSPHLARAAAGFNTARAAIDLRLVDTTTGRVVAATTVEGSATGVTGAADLARGVLGAGASGYASTPIQRAMRDMVEKSAAFITARTPAQYYH